MTGQTSILPILEEIANQLQAKAGTREHFYIIKWFSHFLEFLAGKPYNSVHIPLSVRKRYFSPFEQALSYFLVTSRFDEARKIFQFAFQDIHPTELIGHYIESFGNIQDAEEQSNLLIYTDRLITFLVQLGYEKELETKVPSPLDHPLLDQVLNTNWAKLFKRFCQCQTGKDCYNLLHDLFIYCNKLSLRILSIENSSTNVKARKWLLKRQGLGLYTAALAGHLEPGYFHSSKHLEMLENLNDWAMKTYLNYLYLPCYALENTVLSAILSLENMNGQPQYIPGIPANLKQQIRKISHKFPDIKDFLEATMGLKISFDWIKNILDRIEELSLIGQQPQDILDWLNEILGIVRAENTNFLKNKTIIENQQEIASRILSNEAGSFWERCSKLFNTGRLHLLAASIDNKYSVGSAFFFDTPAIKLDKGQPIPTELCLLNRWGSTTGVFERNKNFEAGISGGYFLFHHGFGLAIDPGPDFLSNLTSHTDFDLMDIDGIACTHTHYDHFADFQRIVLGTREYNLHAGYKQLYYFLPDQDDHILFPARFKEEFCIDILNESAHLSSDKSQSGCYYFPNTPWGMQNGICVQPIEVVHEIYTDQRYFDKNIRSAVLEEYEKRGKTLGAKRDNPTIFSRDEGKRLWSYGLLVKPMQDGEPLTEILFTGDAEYENDLFAGLQPEVVIMNCSSVRFNDLTAEHPLHSNPNAPAVKRNQLGYTGISRLIQRFSESKINIISDFFEAQSETDARWFIAEALRADLSITGKAHGAVMVGESGMRIRWKRKNEPAVYCTPFCGDNGFVLVQPGSPVTQCKKNISCKREFISPFPHHCTATNNKSNLYKW